MLNGKGITGGLVCLICKSEFELHKSGFPQPELQCPSCRHTYPVVNGIPVLIDERTSIFTYQDFTSQQSLFFDISTKGKMLNKLAKFLPTLGGNNLGKTNYSLLGQLLKWQGRKARVLILGGSIPGDGIEDFLQDEHLDIVESDVSFGPRTQIVLDAHHIPYADQTFDCVVAQAVLEHVMDPQQCVKEIYRVLKPEGLVYAETPFMQQVHGNAYDFTRYTRSGHRRLFRYFAEVKSGVAGGSGTAFAWSYQYLLLSLFGFNQPMRFGIKVFARVTGFWLKYFDYLERWNKRAIDAASGFYFLGRKSMSPISDKEIIRYFQQ